MTCYAAYHIYQTKHLTVFFEKGVSQADIEEIGKKLDSMNAFSGVELQIEYVSADQAWEDFCSEYFDDSFLQKFDDNPLKDSANYQVTVKLFSDTENVRKQIERIPGVRKVIDLKEENKNGE